MWQKTLPILAVLILAWIGLNITDNRKDPIEPDEYYDGLGVMPDDCEEVNQLLRQENQLLRDMLREKLKEVYD